MPPLVPLADVLSPAAEDPFGVEVSELFVVAPDVSVPPEAPVPEVPVVAPPAPVPLPPPV
jgi:hypothetical protein